MDRRWRRVKLSFTFSFIKGLFLCKKPLYKRGLKNIKPDLDKNYAKMNILYEKR